MSIAASGTRAPLGMPLDVYRDDDGSYQVDLDLPGVDPASIEVTVDSGALTIQAERTPAYREGQQVIVAERSQGSFARQLSLGEGVDSENLTAAYTDGVLHVTIPASPRSQPRRVEITHAAGAGPTISGSPSNRVTRLPPARATPAEPPVLTSSASRPRPHLVDAHLTSNL